NKPKGAKSAYNFFLQDQREKLQREEGKFSLADFSKVSAEKWKNMSEEEKETFVQKAGKDKERFKEEMQSYTPPPSEESGKKKRKKQTKDPNKPKRCLSAYFHFINLKRDDVKKDNPNASGGALSKVLGEMWSKMTDDDKTQYQDMAKKDKVRYESEMKAFKDGKLPAKQNKTKEVEEDEE
ncbi:predicted protein, partial [Nematostella vectensis]